MNSAHLSGRLTADIETATFGERTVSKFTVAWNHAERRLFLPVEAWNMPHLPTHLRKGSRVLVSGALRQDEWEKDGQKRSRLLLNAYQVEFLDPKPQAEAGGDDEPVESPSPRPASTRAPARRGP